VPVSVMFLYQTPSVSLSNSLTCGKARVLATPHPWIVNRPSCFLASDAEDPSLLPVPPLSRYKSERERVAARWTERHKETKQRERGKEGAA